MANSSKYILRKRSNNKYLIITVIIIVFLLFLLVSFAYFAILDYEYANGKITNGGEYIIAISKMSSFNFSLPLANAINDILSFQLKIWWVYIATLLSIWIYITSRNRNDFKGVEHGSAGFLDDYDLKNLFQPKDANGIPIGLNTYIPYDSSAIANCNEIVIGGSGAGKTLRKIKADILQFIKEGVSVVATDPKGELYRDTAKILWLNGYKVKVLNLKEVMYSNSYNPFLYIVNEQDVVNVANLFMKNTAGEGEKEDFWSGSALELLTATMTYLFKSKNEIKSFGRVVRLVNSIQYKNNQISMECEFAICLNKHATEFPNDVCSVTWRGFQGLPQETFASITKVLTQRLSLWATEALDAITSTDEMDFDNVGVEKTAIFLIVPAARNPYKVVANLFYSQLFERLMRVAENKYDGCLPRMVSCELDEFANIGEIPAFNEILSVVRSYNIRICVVLQGLSQLKALYEKNYDSIIGNMDIFTLLGSKDKDTLDYVSEKLGKITVRNDSRSFNRGGTAGNSGGSDTEAYSERPLLYPDEVKKAVKPKGRNRKYGGCAIIFVGYEDPIYVPKFDTFNHPLFPYCGSKYKGFRHNNTYIENEYKPVWCERQEEYKKMYNSRKTSDEEMLKEAELQAKIKDKEEQLRLEKEFETAQEIQAPDANRIPTEEEYCERCNEMDTHSYSPVDDYENTNKPDVPDIFDANGCDDDENDCDDNEIAPIVGDIDKEVTNANS